MIIDCVFEANQRKIGNNLNDQLKEINQDKNNNDNTEHSNCNHKDNDNDNDSEQNFNDSENLKVNSDSPIGSPRGNETRYKFVDGVVPDNYGWQYLETTIMFIRSI